MPRLLKNSLICVLLFCIIGIFNVHASEKSHTPKALASATTPPPTLSIASAVSASAATAHPTISLPNPAGIEVNAEALGPLLANIGANAGANAHLTVNVDPAVVRQMQEALKDLGQAGAKEVATAIKTGNFTVNVPVTHSLQINAGTAATVIGAFILAKSLYEEFWGTQSPITNQNLLKEASSNAQNIDEDTDEKNLDEIILAFVREHKNAIGGIVGLLLMCNQPILSLFGSKS